MANATVTVTSVETGVHQATTTNRSGEWQILNLNPGNYSFTVLAAGFKTTDHEPLELQVGDRKTADTALQIGSATDQVDVSSEAPLLDLSAAVSGSVITTKELEDIPTISHIPSLLIGLTPGALTGPPTGGGAHLWSNISGSTVQVAGLGSVAGSGAGNNNYANIYVLDGGYDSNAAGQQSFIPPQDSVSEFRVAINAFDASLGRETGGVISTVTRSGTKAFHGNLYEYNQNNFLNANTYIAKQTNTPKAPIHVNEYGGGIGGPVWLPHLYDGRKRGTFFFFNYDAIVNKTPGTQGTMSLPTLAERNGDFRNSYVVQSGVKYPFMIYDPTTIDANGNRKLFNGPCPDGTSGMCIPASRIDPIAKAYLALMPAPDNGGDATGPDSNNYVKREVQDDKFKSYLARIDQAWNNANHSYASLRMNNWSEISYDPFGPSNILNGIAQTRMNKGITLDHSVVLNSRMVLDLRYNVMNYYGTSFSSSLGTDPTKFGFSSAFASLASIPSLPRIDNGSVTAGAVVVGAEASGIGTNQDSYNNDVFQTITAQLTQTHGNHSFKYGFEHMIQQQGTGGPGTVAGNFTFGNNFTNANPSITNPTGSGSGMASFLLGLPTGGSFPVNATAFYSQHYTAGYFQDDWRVSTNFTFNYGLRWDYETGISERHNKVYTRYNPTYVQSGITGPSQANYATLVAASSTSAGVQLLQSRRPTAANFITMGGVGYAGVHGTPDTLYDPRYRYFQPRLGFAYRIYPRTVIRGGAGRFVQSTFNTPSQAGFSQSTNYTATTNNYRESSPATFDNAYSGGLQPITGNSLAEQTNIGQITSFTDPRFGRIYTDEVSTSLQQEFGKFLMEIGFTYNHSHGLGFAIPTNALSPADYLAAYSPTFDATGKPVGTLPGNVQVTNPYKGIAGLPVTSGIYTSSTVAAAQLLRPNPVVNNDIPVTTSGGKDTFYGLLASLNRRFSNGLSVRQSFTWSKDYTQDFFLGNTSLVRYIPRQIYSNDVRFHYTAAPIYELPFGKGKAFLGNSNALIDEVVGGWELTGIYSYASGTPVTLPTNSSFYRGDGSPNIGVTRGKTGTWFDTTAFAPYPTSSTCYTTVHALPSWTGAASLPGYNYTPPGGVCASGGVNNGVYNDFTVRNTLYPQNFGDIRNPPVNDVTLGLRKNFRIVEGVRLQLRGDAFNAFNHARFGNIGTDPTSPYFGKLNGSATLNAVNAPRSIELSGKIFF